MGIKRSQEETGFFALPQRIEKIYYSHGLFCSSHPIPVICFACFFIILCSCPLLHLRLPGNSPQEHVSPVKHYKEPPVDDYNSDSESYRPKWFQGPPAGYILQILIRTAIMPPKEDSPTETLIHSSLKQAFEIVETIRNYQHVTNISIVNLDDVCSHVTESVHQKISPGVLPRYTCLILSPANLWKQDINTFLEDKNVMKTILEDGGKLQENPLLKDILFGIPWNLVGLNKFVGGSRAYSTFVYAITVVMEKYDANFTEGLKLRLQSSYSITEQGHAGGSLNGNITHVYFHDQNNLIEFIPLLVTYVMLFLYIYFSVRKIELVKSKLGMAFTAVVTVIASLSMSIGICTWFGLSFTLKSGEIYLKEIFPYLVVIIGLENILVLTKSVVSTPIHLDVKVRVAQGLSKEGWSITKNLCTELTILTFGFFTFVPAIQEFCLFAVVGLLSDFFLQLVFFATILSIDIRRIEQSLYQGIQTRLPTEQVNHIYPLIRCPVINNSSKPQMKRSRSCSRLNMCTSCSSLGLQQQPPRVVTAPQYQNPILVKVPKRLRLVYFWARCRIFQRAFMITFVVWIFLMSYRSGIVEHFTPTASNTLSVSLEDTVHLSPQVAVNVQSEHRTPSSSSAANSWQVFSNQYTMSENASIAKHHKWHHKSLDSWRQLSPQHWPTLFGYYNISIQRRYISMLPPIPLSVSSESFKTNFEKRFHSQEENVKAQTNSIPQVSDAVHLDHFLDENEMDNNGQSADISQEAFYPSSPQEVILTIILAIPSLIFVVYVMIVLYRCVCTRNYAEWRSSWSQNANGAQGDTYTQLVLEAMPIVLEGHPQEIECMTTDETLVVSSCLAGQLRVWDSSSGECLSVIDRRKALLRQRSRLEHEIDDAEDVASDYGSGSPPSRSDFAHELAHKQFNSCHSVDDVILSSPLHRRLDRENSVLDVPRQQHSVRVTSAVSQENLNSVVPLTPTQQAEGEQTEYFNARPSKDLFRNEPNLSSTITTDFRKVSSPALSFRRDGGRKTAGDGFDFSKFDAYYDEYRQLVDETEERQLNKRKTPSTPVEHSPGGHSISIDPGATPGDLFSDESLVTVSPVWCLDCIENLVVVGCSDGRIEIWDGLSGVLTCTYDDETGYGVTGICLVGNRIIASRLHGAIDFLELRPHNDVYASSTLFSTHRRSHVRHGSSSSVGYESILSWGKDLTCTLIQTIRAHQQPITELQVEGGRAVTGSQDHSLKVFRVEDAICQLTLHGHHGPISALFIDKLSPITAASGAQDGAVCLWDLLTGACVCRLQGHDGMVAAVTYTDAYVLSAGEDTRLLVWERFQGHLLNTINLLHSYCSNMVMLTDNLLLTARQGSLVVWDIRVGEPVRIVRLGHSDQSVFVRQIQHVGNAIVCDYGNQLRVVQFPTIVEKVD